jgi:hypothetical protein
MKRAIRSDLSAAGRRQQLADDLAAFKNRGQRIEVLDTRARRNVPGDKDNSHLFQRPR